MRRFLALLNVPRIRPFPFLFGGTFIEAVTLLLVPTAVLNFPSFSEGLSLRAWAVSPSIRSVALDFPSFSEGLSLRESLCSLTLPAQGAISLPFRRDFH